MYGTRGVAHNLHNAYTQQFMDVGFKQGFASPCIFYRPEKKIRAYVHGDDYVSTGFPVRWVQKRLEATFQTNIQPLGPAREHSRQVEILNRLVLWNGHEGVTYEAEPRFVEFVTEQLGLNGASAASTQGTTEEGRIKDEHREMVNDEDDTRYRAAIARCIVPAPVGFDIAHVVKDFTRAIAKFTNGDAPRLKRLGRYPKGRPRFQQRYESQIAQETMRTYSDAGWVGCKEARKSATCGCVTICTHNIMTWNRSHFFIV